MQLKQENPNLASSTNNGGGLDNEGYTDITKEIKVRSKAISKNFIQYKSMFNLFLEDEFKKLFSMKTHID